MSMGERYITEGNFRLFCKNNQMTKEEARNSSTLLKDYYYYYLVFIFIFFKRTNQMGTFYLVK